MDHKEFTDELKMTYEELQYYLIQKYGAAKYDYFADTECTRKPIKVSRTREGLYCHHMDEDKGGNLGNPLQAKIQPFERQKKREIGVLQYFRAFNFTYEDCYRETKENAGNT